ncbi:alpha,alpha-trehalase ath1 [Neophaeococcomyces mojaviensis]|uniref:Alpha,alpha-trehalase ath1 n=1 Tax=Neophaeococcomyces mojaviensis TaxID=3383035 RepID=A0ACC3A760_9EURO|nr:alpha,alpha-trehalase ath1 [Knufia sp. JES_112]
MRNPSLLNSFLSLPFLLANITIASPFARQQDDASSSTSIYATRFANVTWNNDEWLLTTTDLDQGHYQSRISLANGYIGINVAALGPFFEYDQPVAGDVLNGWPLFNRRQTFATVGGFWGIEPELNGTNFPWLSQYGWDTAISGIPHWAGISLDLGGSAALHSGTNASEIQNFTSSIDMKHGLMNWAFTWSPPSHGSFDISYQMFLHKVNVTQAYISMNITAHADTRANLVNILDGDCATRTTPGPKGSDSGFIFSSVHPDGLNNITAYVYANLSVPGVAVSPPEDTYNASYIGKNTSSIAAALPVNLTAGTTVSAFKYVGIASTDAFSNPQQMARNSASAAMNVGYTSALRSHIAEWSTLFPPTSVDNFSFPDNGSLPGNNDIIEAQIMAVVNPFYLLQNTVSEAAANAYTNASINSHSISVGGLGSDSYAGQIFWDAEVWMQPGLVATFPYAARGILNYRIERYAQAQANIETAYQSSKNTTTYSSNGAIFPWTSGRYGNCTATGPCWDYEYHINGDIGLDFINYWVTSGDTAFFEKNLQPIYDSISITLSEILTPNGSNWALTNMTDPDEFANHIDNGGFTMALIGETLENANEFREYFNQSTNQTWTSQAENVLISKDTAANVLLEYTGMNGTVSVKQADVVLVTYPLSYSGQNYTAEDSLSDLDYYANKQSADGPGMTYSVFSIVANEASPSGCSAYTYQQYSTQPYVRGPWFQFSEQLIDNYGENGGFHPAFPFLTGHGGANQVILFGYLGLRLVPDWVLHIDPSLPPQIPNIRYRTFYWQGWPITSYSNQTHTTLSRSSTIPIAAGAVSNSTFTHSPIPVAVGSINGAQTHYSLPPNGTLTVPNRQYGNNASIPNNLCQCKPAFSDAEIVPGQFAISAVDGASSTKFQPAYANQTAQLTVSLPLGHRVLGFRFEWAQAPPYNYSIFFHNDSSTSTDFGIATAQTIIQGARVSISDAFTLQDVAKIEQPKQNTSSIWFNGTKLYSDGQLQVTDLWTSRYATLAIWGSLYNSSLTPETMSGDGAQVAEWNVIVDKL